MKKIFWIDHNEELCLMLGSRALIHFFHHYIIHSEVNTILQRDLHCSGEEVYFRKITLNNLDDCIGGDFSVWRMKQYILHQSKLVDGFLMYDAATKKTVGYIWVMFKGGDEVQYKIRNVDAYGFDICVLPDYRGKGYCGLLLRKLAEYIESDKNIHELTMVVRSNNFSALRAYKKMGFNITGQRCYIRLLGQHHGLNIPYYIL